MGFNWINYFNKIKEILMFKKVIKRLKKLFIKNNYTSLDTWHDFKSFLKEYNEALKACRLPIPVKPNYKKNKAKIFSNAIFKSIK